jgi:hypothetical protein
VPRREELALAARLDRVLDGHERADGELAALAALLERAAKPTRFEVDEADVQAALGRVRPRLARTRHRPRLRLWPALGVAAVAAAAAVVAILLTRGPGLEVEDDALAALGGSSSILRVVERIEPTRPGAFPISVRVGWLAPDDGKARWDQYVRGRKVTETLVERGRVSRYLLTENVVIVGTSCRAFASGCAELVDPIDLYRRALQSQSARTASTTYAGRPAYVLTLPVQTLPDALRIEQRVTIDKRTFLPRLIEWLERRPGEEPRSFSLIRIRKVRVLPRASGRDVFQLAAPPNVRIVQRVGPGVRVVKFGERALTFAQARSLRPRLRWLGPDYFGQRVTAIEEVRWNAGTAYRIRYGEMLTLWNYGAFVPPEIAANRYVLAKIIPLPGGGIVRFYQTLDGRLVAEREGAERSVALIGPQLGKEDFFQALDRLLPLR